jgi:hypothetical protein
MGRTPFEQRQCKHAYDKRMEWRGAIFNHPLGQITGFRVFDRQASKRADDLADAFMYAVLRCLATAGRVDGTDASAPHEGLLPSGRGSGYTCRPALFADFGRLSGDVATGLYAPI